MAGMAPTARLIHKAPKAPTAASPPAAAPPIGADAWGDELVTVRLDRRAVEVFLDEAFGGRAPDSLSPGELEGLAFDAQDALDLSGPEGPLAYALRAAGAFDPGGRLGEDVAFALATAAEVLLDARGPRRAGGWHYASGWGVRDLHRREGRAALRWYARQLAARLAHGDDEVRRATAENLEALWGGEPGLAETLFPPLAGALSGAGLERLLRSSGLVPWALKRELCERLAPAIFRASPPPPIDSVEWGEELALLGVAVDEVRALCQDLTFASGAGGHRWQSALFTEGLDLDGVGGDSDLWPAQRHFASSLSRRARRGEYETDADSPARLALQGAVAFRGHDRSADDLGLVRTCVWRPDHDDAPYAALMRRWCARQIAACLLEAWGPAEGFAPRPAIDDFFDVPAVAAQLFPWLVEDLPAETHPALLARSATVVWAGKRDFYTRFARDPADHARLADALWASCTSGVFLSVDAAEGLALLGRLHAADGARRREIDAALRGRERAFTAAAGARPESR